MRKPAVLIACVLCVTLFACSACAPAAPGREPTTPAVDGPTSTPTRNTPRRLFANASPERVQIRWFVGLGTGTSKHSQEVERAFVEAFNASQDEIELLLKVSPGGGVYGGADSMRAEIAAGRPPDVVGPMGTLGLSMFPDLWLDLDPLLEGEGDLLGSLDPAVADAWRVDGQLLGLPSGINPSVLYYNRDLFDAAGLPYPPRQYGEPYADGDEWTIEKIQEIAMRLTLDGDGNDARSPDFRGDQIEQYGYDWRWASGRGMAYLFGAGSVLDTQGNAMIPSHWRAAYHWYYEGMWTKRFIPDGQAYERRFRTNPFVSGEVAMLQSHLWYLAYLADASFRWDLGALPSYDGACSVRWDGTMIGIANTTQHRKEAFRVAYALATAPELLVVWGGVPVAENLRAAFFEELEDQYPGVGWAAALEGLDHLSMPPHGSMMPNHINAYSRFDELRDLMQARSNLNLDAEIDRLESDLQALFSEALRPTDAPTGSTELRQEPASR